MQIVCILQFYFCGNHSLSATFMLRRYTAKGLCLEEGSTFQNVAPDVVINFLKDRKIDYYYIDPLKLQILNDGNKLFLQVKKEQNLFFPIRRSFFEKLLMWYKIPLNFAYQADLDLVILLLNNVFKLIKRSHLRIVIENDSALTITSPDYVDIFDIDIIENRTPNQLLRITRTDMFTKLDLVESKTINPLPNDTCGLGLSVFNSETGFYNFSVKVYLLRYICTNGAIINIDVFNEKIPHYNTQVSSLNLQSSISNQLNLMNKKYDIIKRRFEIAAELKLSTDYFKVVNEKIDSILGYKKGSYFLFDFKEKDSFTLFDLFNFITDKAKLYEPNIRLKLEEAAGKLILN